MMKPCIWNFEIPYPDNIEGWRVLHKLFLEIEKKHFKSMPRGIIFKVRLNPNLSSEVIFYVQNAVVLKEEYINYAIKIIDIYNQRMSKNINNIKFEDGGVAVYFKENVFLRYWMVYRDATLLRNILAIVLSFKRGSIKGSLNVYVEIDEKLIKIFGYHLNNIKTSKTSNL